MRSASRIAELTSLLGKVVMRHFTRKKWVTWVERC